MSGLLNPKLARSIRESGDTQIADPQDFTRLITLPQLFVFVLLILAESLTRDEPLSLVVKLAGISYLLLSTVMMQVIVKALSLRYICYHQFILAGILLVLTLISSQDCFFNFYLPLTLFVLCSQTLRLTPWELFVMFLPVAILVLFATPALALIGSAPASTALAGMISFAAGVIMQSFICYFSPHKPKKNKILYYQPKSRPARSSKTTTKEAATVEEDTDFWYQVYYTMLFQEMLSEVVWRLAILYLLSYTVFAHVFLTLNLDSSLAVYVPLTLALFQLFLHTRLVTQKDYHGLLHRVFLLSLGCLLSSVITLAFIPQFDLVAYVFLLFQVLWISLIPWNNRYSLSLAAVSVAGVALVTSNFETWPILIGSAVLIVFVGLRLSSASYLSLVIRTALSFLGRYCGIAPATSTILRMMTRLFSTVTGTPRVLIVYGNGASEVVGPKDERSGTVDPLLARAFLLKLQQFDRAEGIISCGILEERLQGAVLDWFHAVPHQAFFFIVELIAGDKDEKALIMLPVSMTSRIFGLQRTFMALSVLLGVARISFSSARTRFQSSDVMLTYQRTLAEREDEFNEIVHLVNNTAQDIAIYCDQARDQLKTNSPNKSTEKTDSLLRSIEYCSRNLSLGISDLKLIKEITSIRALDRSDVVAIQDILEDLDSFGKFHTGRRNQKFEMDFSGTEKFAVRTASREYFETIIRLLVRIAARRCSASGTIRVTAKNEDKSLIFRILDTGDVGEYYDSAAISREALSKEDVSQEYLKAATEFARLSGGSFQFNDPQSGFSGSMKLTLPRGEIRVGAPIIPGQWVLLVDDNAQVTTFYAHVAEALQLRYFTAASVSDACKIIDEQGKPRLVITDLQLGESSGFDLIQVVRKKFGTEIPVIVVSGNPEDGIATRLKEYGATKYLMKPVGRRRLFAEIKSIL